MSIHLKDLMENDGAICPSCGKRHFGLLRDYIAEENAIAKLPALLEKYGCKRPFVLCDPNTYRAAGKACGGGLEGGRRCFFASYHGFGKACARRENGRGSADVL